MIFRNPIHAKGKGHDYPRTDARCSWDVRVGHSGALTLECPYCAGVAQRDRAADY